VNNTSYLYQEIIKIELQENLNTTYSKNQIINLFNYNKNNSNSNQTINLKIEIDTFNDNAFDIYIMNTDGEAGIDGMDGKEPIEINLNELLKIYTKLKYLTLEFSENISIYGSAGNGIPGKNIQETIGEVGKGGRIINIIKEDDIDNFLNFNINFNNTNKLYIGGDGNIGPDYKKAKSENGSISKAPGMPSKSSSDFNFLTEVEGTYAVTHNFGRYTDNTMLSIFINYWEAKFTSSELYDYNNYKDLPTGNYNFDGEQNLYDSIEGSIFKKNNRFFQITEAMSVYKVESVSFYKGRYDFNYGLRDYDRIRKKYFYIKYWEVTEIKIKKPRNEDAVNEQSGSRGKQYGIKTKNNKQRIKINGLEISDNPEEDKYDSIPNLNLKINYNN